MKRKYTFRDDKDNYPVSSSGKLCWVSTREAAVRTARQVGGTVLVTLDSKGHILDEERIEQEDGIATLRYPEEVDNSLPQVTIPAGEVGALTALDYIKLGLAEESYSTTPEEAVEGSHA